MNQNKRRRRYITNRLSFTENSSCTKTINGMLPLPKKHSDSTKCFVISAKLRGANGLVSGPSLKGRGRERIGRPKYAAATMEMPSRHPWILD